MSEIFRCLVEVPKHGIKKNSKEIRMNFRTKKRFIGSNSKAQYLENFLASVLLRQRLLKRVDTIDFDVNAKIVFFFPESVYFTKAGKRSNKVGDLSNLYQNVEDCLQKAQILQNDSLIASHDGSARKPIEGSKYMLEIVLTKVAV